MIRNKDDFKTEYKRIANTMFRRDPEHLDDKDKFAVLARLVEREAQERTGAVEILSTNKKKRRQEGILLFDGIPHRKADGELSAQSRYP